MEIIKLINKKEEQIIVKQHMTISMILERLCLILRLRLSFFILCISNPFNTILKHGSTIA